MRIELLVVADCPHESVVAGVLTTVLSEIGLESVGFSVTVIESQDDAELRHFIGSPTICVNGADVFPQPERPAAIACRRYPGRTGVPELGEVRQALKRAAALPTAQ